MNFNGNLHKQLSFELFLKLLITKLHNYSRKNNIQNILYKHLKNSLTKNVSVVHRFPHKFMLDTDLYSDAQSVTLTMNFGGVKIPRVVNPHADKYLFINYIA